MLYFIRYDQSVGGPVLGRLRRCRLSQQPVLLCGVRRSYSGLSHNLVTCSRVLIHSSHNIPCHEVGSRVLDVNQYSPLLCSNVQRTARVPRQAPLT